MTPRNHNALSTTSDPAVGSTDWLGVWSYGQYVWTTVSVNGQTQRMAKGVITGIHSGYCDVDVMSLHGGAPWIQQHTNSSLEPVICKACECKVDKDGCGCNPADA